MAADVGPPTFQLDRPPTFQQLRRLEHVFPHDVQGGRLWIEWAEDRDLPDAYQGEGPTYALYRRVRAWRPAGSSNVDEVVYVNRDINEVLARAFREAELTIH